MNMKKKVRSNIDDNKRYNYKKIIGFFISFLLIVPVLPISIADTGSATLYDGDVEIEILTGFRDKDFGIGITVNMLNHKTEDVTVFFNLTLDYIIINDLDTTSKFNYTISPDLPVYYHVGLIPCRPDGIKFVSITVEAENIIVTRKGLSIRNFVILFK